MLAIFLGFGTSVNKTQFCSQGTILRRHRMNEQVNAMHVAYYGEKIQQDELLL